MVLEEHLGYISDLIRLDRFQQAIARTVSPGDLVVDIGCGLGVLGLMCLKSGAAHCWGIDCTAAIEIAHETMTRSGLSDRYSCIREQSFRAILPQPVDLIICDHVGYFGIDYGIIELMNDARHRFLKPAGRAVPSRIKLMLAGVSSNECRSKSERWHASDIPVDYRWLREYGVNTKQGHTFRPSDLCTQPAILGTIDLLSSNPELFSFKAKLAASRDGVLDGLAGWFDCQLADDVWMTNSPLEAGRIDRDQAFLPFEKPIEISAGDSVDVSVMIRHDTGLIAWTVRDPRSGKQRKQSNWASLIVSKANLTQSPSKLARLSPSGRARQILFEYIDGTQTSKEIELAILNDHPDLLPSSKEISRFVQHELARSTE